LTDFGLSTGFSSLHDNNYYQQLLHGKSNKPRDRNSVAIDQINLTVSNRSQINEWRRSRRLIAYSTVGTPDYIAPEIFTGQGYSFSCDWWSLGTIMYECLVGWPPFCAEDHHDTYRKIVNWRQTLYFPDDIQLGIESENLTRRYAINMLQCSSLLTVQLNLQSREPNWTWRRTRIEGTLFLSRRPV
jgi:protein-serine/threonine kinase